MNKKKIKVKFGSIGSTPFRKAYLQHNFFFSEKEIILSVADKKEKRFKRIPDISLKGKTKSQIYEIL